MPKKKYKKTTNEHIEDVTLAEASKRGSADVGNDRSGQIYARGLTSGTLRGEQRIDGQIILNDEADDRILIGIQEGGFGTKNLGIKVSQEGQDVKTATDDNLIMSSAFNMFKIVDSGTATRTLPNPVTANTTYSKTVAHNLGYAPMALVYVSDGSTIAMMPYTTHAATSGNFFAQNYFVVDSTNIVFYHMNGGSAFFNGVTLTYKYFLIRETAN